METVACHKNHIEIVRMLLDAGAEQNCVSNKGFSALMRAYRKGHIEIVRMLLNGGAETNLV